MEGARQLCYVQIGVVILHLTVVRPTRQSINYNYSSATDMFYSKKLIKKTDQVSQKCVPGGLLGSCILRLLLFYGGVVNLQHDSNLIIDLGCYCGSNAMFRGSSFRPDYVLKLSGMFVVTCLKDRISLQTPARKVKH